VTVWTLTWVSSVQQQQFLSSEQSYALSDAQVAVNSSSSRNADRMQHATAVKGSINRTLPIIVKRHPTIASNPTGTPSRIRQCRSNASRGAYVREMFIRVRSSNYMGIKKRIIRMKHGKRETEHLLEHPFMEAELAACTRLGSTMLTGADVLEAAAAFDSTRTYCQNRKIEASATKQNE